MLRIYVFVMIALFLSVSMGAVALTGTADSPVGALNTIPPVFNNLAVAPVQAAVDDTVSITFNVSKSLDGDPVVLVNGQAAQPIMDSKNTFFMYSYIVSDTDPVGPATISITGWDLLGNTGSLVDTESLDIIPSLAQVPIRPWSIAVALVIVGCAVLAWRRQRAAAAFLVLAAMLLAPYAAFAQEPTVSNVTFAQGPGQSGTQVEILYDLVAPNGPCDITVLLSKDGGVTFDFEVNAISGAVQGVGTGTEHAILWDIAAEYPNEDIPAAALRVIADDGQYLLRYTAGPNGSISGDAIQTVAPGADGAPVEAVPDQGFAFVQWDDGVMTALRQDTNVVGDIDVTALFEAAAPSPDHIVGPGEDFETLAEAVASAEVLDGHVILVKNHTYVMTAAVNINKELHIIGESREGVVFQNDTVAAPALNVLFTVSADNVTLSQMTLVHHSTNANAFAVSAQAAPFPNQKIEAFTMTDCHVQYSKHGVFYRSRNSLMRDLRLEVIAGSGTRYALLPAGNGGDSHAIDCVFVDNLSTNNRLIYMNGIGGASDQDWAGSFHIIGSTSEGFVSQFVNHDSLVGAPGAFELVVKDNVIQETNAFVVVLGANGDLYSRVVIANNSLTHNHHSSGYGKGAFGIVDSTGGSFRSTPLPVYAAGNTLGQPLFRVDWIEAPGSSDSIVGYSPSASVGNLIPGFIDFNLYEE